LAGAVKGGTIMTSHKRVDLAHFTLRQMMELEACTRCGECIETCPTFVEKRVEAIHPLQKIASTKRFWKADHLGLLARLFGLRRPTLEEQAGYGQGVYACTLCARCHVVCPVQIDTRSLWISMREQLVDWNLHPEAFDLLRDRVTTQYNISGEDNANRLVWSENMERIPAGLDRRQGAETVYFAGCVGAMYPRVYAVPQSFVQILERAGQSFTTLGGEEWCCGFPLQIAGMGAHVPTLARHNVDAVRAIGARQLVTTCPSCYHTWAHDYPRLLGEPLGFEVLHATEWLAALIDQGCIELKGFAQPVTYHDPCDLGRTSGIYEAPRRIIQAIPGIEFLEMEENREMALCCGGGGDAEMADAELTAAVGQRRIRQVQDTGARVVVSACQQCVRTLAEAARRNRIRVRAMDITELVWRAMQE
jgi:Fe-S oxidoreductase